MSLLVTGTIGIDSVQTPQGRADEVLGGSAAYFALAASLLSPVRLVGVVGEDFPSAFLDAFKGRPIDTKGLEVRRGSKTFRWAGKYFDDMNTRESLRTELNVVAEKPPTIPEAFRGSKYVFLANTHPGVQREFIEQLAGPELVVCDTMDLWIENFREELLGTLRAVHGVVLNDSEARLLTGLHNMVLAGRSVLEMGPRFVVIKKGEHGSVLVSGDCVFTLPAYPTTSVKDPTGAGDSFAAGMMGHLAAVERTDLAALKSAMAVGTCVASIVIEDFSLGSIRSATRQQVDERLAHFKSLQRFD